MPPNPLSFGHSNTRSGARAVYSISFREPSRQTLLLLVFCEFFPLSSKKKNKKNSQFSVCQDFKNSNCLAYYSRPLDAVDIFNIQSSIRKHSWHLLLAVLRWTKPVYPCPQWAGANRFAFFADFAMIKAQVLVVSEMVTSDVACGLRTKRPPSFNSRCGKFSPEIPFKNAGGGPKN